MAASNARKARIWASPATVAPMALASRNGWLIDGGLGYDNHDAADAADAASLYRLLEEEVVPTYYDRDANGVPHRWLAVVKESIRTVAPRFSARRMVKEYVDRMYAPALEHRLEVDR